VTIHQNPDGYLEERRKKKYRGKKTQASSSEVKIGGESARNQGINGAEEIRKIITGGEGKEDREENGS
jgi:hypothetical protein